jgi:hypothetical protein
MKYELRYRENTSCKLERFVGEEAECEVLFRNLLRKHTMCNIKVRRLG